MNYIRVGNGFINLSRTKNISVLSQVRDSEITIVVGYPEGNVSFTIPSNSNNLDEITLTPNNVANAIQEAIMSCADADCENIADYIEEEEDEDY